MHCHLKDIWYDYGPVQSFWLFSFERCNGILGNQPNNNHSIEPQLMQRFLQEQLAHSLSLPDEFRQEFLPVCQFNVRQVGSLSFDSSSEPIIQFPTTAKRGVLTDYDFDHYTKFIAKLYPSDDIHCNTTYMKYSNLTIRGKVYNTLSRKVLRGYTDLIVMAEWDSSLFGNFPSSVHEANHPNSKIRPAKVHFFMKSSFYSHNNQCDIHVNLAYVSWCLPHPYKSKIGKPAQVWTYNEFEQPGLYSFVPLNLIKCRCAHCIFCIQEESVLVVVPLLD